MQPIVNPLFFYFAAFADNIKEVGVALGLIIGLILGAMVILGPIFIIEYDGLTDSIAKLAKKGLKIMIILGTICILISTFVPSKETIYQMAVSSVVTQDNIDYVGDKASDLIDYIVDKVDQMVEDNEKK